MHKWFVCSKEKGKFIIYEFEERMEMLLKVEALKFQGIEVMCVWSERIWTLQE